MSENLNFRGGKGIACSLGLIIMVFPITVPICLLVFAMTVFVSKYVSLGSILALSILAIIQHGANIVRLLKGTENKIGKNKWHGNIATTLYLNSI